MIDADTYELDSFSINNLGMLAVRMRHCVCGEFVSSWSDSPSMKQLINTMYIHELECSD